MKSTQKRAADSNLKISTSAKGEFPENSIFSAANSDSLEQSPFKPVGKTSLNGSSNKVPATKLEVTVIPVDGDPYSMKITVPQQVLGKLDAKGKSIPSAQSSKAQIYQ